MPVTPPAAAAKSPPPPPPDGGGADAGAGSSFEAQRRATEALLERARKLTGSPQRSPSGDASPSHRYLGAPFVARRSEERIASPPPAPPPAPLPVRVREQVAEPLVSAEPAGGSVLGNLPGFLGEMERRLFPDSGPADVPMSARSPAPRYQAADATETSPGWNQTECMPTPGYTAVPLRADVTEHAPSPSIVASVLDRLQRTPPTQSEMPEPTVGRLPPPQLTEGADPAERIVARAVDTAAPMQRSASPAAGIVARAADPKPSLSSGPSQAERPSRRSPSPVSAEDAAAGASDRRSNPGVDAACAAEPVWQPRSATPDAADEAVSPPHALWPARPSSSDGTSVGAGRPSRDSPPRPSDSAGSRPATRRSPDGSPPPRTGIDVAAKRSSPPPSIGVEGRASGSSSPPISTAAAATGMRRQSPGHSPPQVSRSLSRSPPTEGARAAVAKYSWPPPPPPPSSATSASAAVPALGSSRRSSASPSPRPPTPPLSLQSAPVLRRSGGSNASATGSLDALLERRAAQRREAGSSRRTTPRSCDGSAGRAASGTSSPVPQAVAVKVQLPSRCRSSSAERPQSAAGPRARSGTPTRSEATSDSRRPARTRTAVRRTESPASSSAQTADRRRPAPAARRRPAPGGGDEQLPAHSPPPPPQTSSSRSCAATAYEAAARQWAERRRSLDDAAKDHRRIVSELTQQLLQVADRLHACRAKSRSASRSASAGAAERKEQLGRLLEQRDELRQQYGVALALAARRRDAERARAADSRRVQLREAVEQLEARNSAVAESERTLEQLQHRSDGLRERLRRLRGRHHGGVCQRLSRCRERIRVLREAFPAEAQLADLKAVDDACARAHAETDSQHKASITVLRRLAEAAAGHGAEQRLRDAVAQQSQELADMRQEASRQASELRHRRAAEAAWRPFLHGSSERGVAFVAAVRRHCEQLRFDRPEDNGAAAAAAAIVEGWLERRRGEQEGLREDLNRFVEALASESDAMEDAVRRNLSFLEARTAALASVVAGNDVAAELRKAESVRQHDAAREAERRAAAALEQAEVEKCAPSPPMLHSIPGEDGDLGAVLRLGTPQDRAQYIACLLRAEEVLSERTAVWEAQGRERDELPHKEAELAAETERLLAEVAGLIDRTKDKASSDRNHIAELRVEISELRQAPSTPGSPAADAGDLWVQRQLLDSIEDEIQRLEQADRRQPSPLSSASSPARKEVAALERQQASLEAELRRVRAEYRDKAQALRRSADSARAAVAAHARVFSPPSNRRKAGQTSTPPRRPAQSTPSPRTGGYAVRHARRRTDPPHPSTPPTPPEPPARALPTPPRMAQVSPPPVEPLRTEPSPSPPPPPPAPRRQPPPRPPLEVSSHDESDVRLFGPAIAPVPFGAAMQQLRLLRRLVTDGTPVVRLASRRDLGGRSPRREGKTGLNLRLSADLSRAELRAPGKRIAADFARVEHMTRASAPSAASHRTAQKHGPVHPFTIAMSARDPLELAALNARDRDDWVSVVNCLVDHRQQLFFLRYNLNRLVPPQ
eukprot:TRINITY_DN14332_c0_g3_i1.p1 TRINITY_DN14332_c0_g3~~TRINITY_DN14332_c0_g3_i1.p1  ORF type:complete len:1530 (+),score=454.27 TRINITY_DN14332_c0_g3_i1:48-4637(+)